MSRTSNKGLIVKKVGMTRVVDDSGNVIPVTLLQVTDQKVTKVLTQERDGYTGFQIGFQPKKEKNLNKPDIFRLRKSDIDTNFSKFKEIRTDGPVEGFEVGTPLSAELFEGVSRVDVTGFSTGKGFQGAVKRWGATIGRMTHGSRFHRRPGSLGQCTSPGRVMKNKHQPGRTGGDRTTVLNLRVVEVDKENNCLVVKGSVPGKGTRYLEVRPSNRGKAQQ